MTSAMAAWRVISMLKQHEVRRRIDTGRDSQRRKCGEGLARWKQLSARSTSTALVQRLLHAQVFVPAGRLSRNNCTPTRPA